MNARDGEFVASLGERIRMMKRYKMVRTGLAALAVPLLLGAAAADDAEWREQKAKYLAASRREWNHNIADWREAAAWTFDDGRLPGDFRVYSGKWVVTDFQRPSEVRMRVLTTSPGS